MRRPHRDLPYRPGLSADRLPRCFGYRSLPTSILLEASTEGSKFRGSEILFQRMRHSLARHSPRLMSEQPDQGYPCAGRLVFADLCPECQTTCWFALCASKLQRERRCCESLDFNHITFAEDPSSPRRSALAFAQGQCLGHLERCRNRECQSREGR
jgi:hypothetical protein